ncbi:hypothetical protein [Nakamurella deserti]|uniref:hypothetical protein n=1 Tax=Nakamurella deserti TaxID=2164074 RepID=UPI001300B88D|nr:hypothetical protein [Nakamurella deserti]
MPTRAPAVTGFPLTAVAAIAVGSGTRVEMALAVPLFAGTSATAVAPGVVTHRIG